MRYSTCPSVQVPYTEPMYFIKDTTMHAIITGATGATGKDLLHLLLKDNSVKQVDIFVRRNPGVEHEKLNTHH